MSNNESVSAVASNREPGLAILTGVNRSGTSFTANLLLELGFDLGPRDLLLGADHRNARGYFENKEVLQTNIQLLLGDWVTPENWVDEIEGRRLGYLARWRMKLAKIQYFLVDPGRIAARAQQAEQADRIKRLAHKYSGSVLNDARFSSTISAWAQHVPVASVLYSFRHPAEVAQSLNRAYGLPIWAGYLFWRQRVLDFFSQAEGMPLVIVHYERFFASEHREAEVQRLFRFMKRDYRREEALATLERVLDHGLRHHVAPGTVRLPARVEAVYQTLQHYHTLHAELSPFRRPPSEIQPAPRLTSAWK
ncbi:MAG: hypothetical protein KA764_12590 [Anaerolineales bacterium]|nr:hypothetical protein [Anaerolineales bacterium]